MLFASFLMLQTPYHEMAKSILDSLLEQCCNAKTEVVKLQMTNMVAAQGWLSATHCNLQV
jgi:hypothetical protein